MATVYLGRGIEGPHAGRLVAIKVMHRHIAMNPDFVMMFLDEARLAARISHPNVVPMLDVDADENGIFLVMGYVEGSSLHRVIQTTHGDGGILPFGASLKILGDALRGLHAAHQLKDADGAPLNLVHRDVSPENILVGVDGRTRITDFGVAHAETRLAPTTQSGQVKGKYAFMSIEQMRNERVDARSDVYSAGVVLWELLAGRRLFLGDNDATVALAASSGATDFPSGINPDVPPELDQLVMRALQRYPEDRHASAASFADSIEQTAQQLGLHIFDGRELSRFLMELDEDVPTAMARHTMQKMAGRIRAEVAKETHQSESDRPSDEFTHEEPTRKHPSKQIRAVVQSIDAQSAAAATPPASMMTDDDDDDEQVATVVRDALDPSEFSDSSITTPRGPLGTQMISPGMPVGGAHGQLPSVGETMDEASTDASTSVKTVELSTQRLPSNRPPRDQREPAPTSPALLSAPSPASLPVPVLAAPAAEATPPDAPVAAAPRESGTASGAEVPRLVIPAEPRFRQINRIVIGVIGAMAVVTVVAVIFAVQPRPEDQDEANNHAAQLANPAELIPSPSASAPPTGAESSEPSSAPAEDAILDAGTDEDADVEDEEDAGVEDEEDAGMPPTAAPPPPPPRASRPRYHAPPPPPPPRASTFRPDDL